MAMVVRSNIMALNANRQLGMNSSAAAKSLEKLSSGFRINRAGDDASGLAISEKMKAQIKGLEQASSNSQDGISLVQTAEGAMTEVHNMLNRMVELATKSANGTMADDVDREAIQDEVDQLLSEIDRIGDATNFNGINLLDGTMAAKGGGAIKSAVGAATDGTAMTAATKAATKFKATLATLLDASDIALNFQFKKVDGTMTTVALTTVKGAGATANAAALVTKLNANADFKAAFGSGAATNTAGKIQVEAKTAGYYDSTGMKAKMASTANSAATTPSAITAGVEGRGAGATLKIGGANLASGATITVGGKTYTMGGANSANTSTAIFSDLATLKAQLKTDGIQLDAANLSAGTVLSFTKLPKTGAAAGELTLQVGDTNDDFNKVKVKVENVKTDGLKIDGLDVSTQTAAGNAIQTVKDAINKVSTNRGTLGALQNRLEYAINNLDVTAENMNGANSRIRDTDMAKEMMSYTKMNVLTQSAQAMLAQANQQPQSILQLLQ